METKLAPEKPDYVAVELKEIERLRRVEEQHNNLRTAAANLIVYLDLGGDHREMLSKLKAALEEK